MSSLVSDIQSLDTKVPMFAEHYRDEDLRIHHMTHIDNLASVLKCGFLYGRNKVRAFGGSTRYGTGKCVVKTPEKSECVDGVLKSNGKGIAVRVDKDWYFK